MDLAASELLLTRCGVFPGDYFRLSPGERAVICAMLIDHQRRREEE